MNRLELKRWLDEGLSLAEIGRRVGRDASTVAYWVQQYGLVANGRDRHAPKGGITREQLEPLINRGATLREIADEVGRSMTTVRYWIKRHQLTRPIDIRRRDRAQAVARGKRTVTGARGRHGETIFVIENSGRLRCRRCRIERVAEARRRTKAILVAEAGGRCVLCGYNRCLAALEFHHRDPKAKSFALSLRGVTRSIAALRAEAAKCVLLCANCHAEVEVGFSKA